MSATATANDPLPPRDTPQMRFWEALNAELVTLGYRELTFGQVRLIHEEALARAKDEAGPRY